MVKKKAPAKRKSAAPPRPAFRHVLVPTDGSRESAAVVKKAVALARGLGARLRAVYVPAKEPPKGYGLGALYGANVIVEHMDDLAKARARKVLEGVKAQAGEAGVSCVGETVDEHDVWPGLLKVAKARRCDLMVVARVGRINPGDPRDASASVLLLK